MMSQSRIRRWLLFSSIWLVVFSLVSPLPATAYEEITVADGGTIRGRVQFVGTIPVRKQLEIKDDKEVCAKTPKYSEKLVISKSRGIKNAVVSLAGITRGKKWGSKRVEFVQRDCQYDPHVITVPIGGAVDIINDDPLTHNIHTFAFENPTMNRGQPKTVRKISTQVEVEELIKVACDVHSWMKAWWKVIEHPYYVVADAEGAFLFTDVPPGTYQLEIWHESLGKLSREVTVKSKKTTTVSLEMKKKKRKRIKLKQ